MWEDKRLRDITEANVRQLANAELEGHLQLEYKSALYENHERGHKEFLQDICMFANAGGGILLIGISEQRDANGQPRLVDLVSADSYLVIRENIRRNALDRFCLYGRGSLHTDLDFGFRHFNSCDFTTKRRELQNG